MKRNTRKVEKRTFTLKNALPSFVSIVTRGANLTPLSELRFSENGEKFSEVEINRIVFSKENFTKETVEQYLQENDYSEYSIEETDDTYVIPGVDSDQFQEVSSIEYGEGVMFFVGKLNEASETDQATVAVVEAEILDFQAPAEVVQEGDLSLDDLKPKAEDEPNEEDEAEGNEGDGEEGDEVQPEEDGADPVVAVAAAEPEVVEAELEVENTSVFNDKLFRERAEVALAAFMEALEAAKTESFSLPVETETVELFTQEQVTEQIEAAIEAFKAENAETIEKPIDEDTIIVQNSHAVQSEEIQDTVSRNNNPENEKFSERKSSDLFGLR